MISSDESSPSTRHLSYPLLSWNLERRHGKYSNSFSVPSVEILNIGRVLGVEFPDRGRVRRSGRSIEGILAEVYSRRYTVRESIHGIDNSPCCENYLCLCGPNHKNVMEIRRILYGDHPTKEIIHRKEIMNTCNGGSDDTTEDKAESVVSDEGSWITLVSLNRLGDLKCPGVDTVEGISRSYKTAIELRSSWIYRHSDEYRQFPLYLHE